jgi:hypothetical protein
VHFGTSLYDRTSPPGQLQSRELGEQPPVLGKVSAVSASLCLAENLGYPGDGTVVAACVSREHGVSKDSVLVTSGRGLW